MARRRGKSTNDIKNQVSRIRDLMQGRVNRGQEYAPIAQQKMNRIGNIANRYIDNIESSEAYGNEHSKRLNSGVGSRNPHTAKEYLGLIKHVNRVESSMTNKKFSGYTKSADAVKAIVAG